MSSWTLRLWILLAGLLVIGAIFAWGKFQERRKRRGARIEPAVGDVGKVTAHSDQWEVIPILRDRQDAPPRPAATGVALSDEELADVMLTPARTVEQAAVPEPEPRK